MDPLKIRARYFFGVLLAAVVLAGVLRHVLHVRVGFSRLEILEGALAAATLCIVLTLMLRPRGRS
jgi:hypothetical protein